MARPSFQATATPCRSSTRLVRPIWRMRYSRLLRSMKPPPALPAKPRSACSTCVSETPNCAMRAVSGSTRNCRTSPPIGITCDTPAIDSRRGRSTKSAYSRARIGSAAVLPSPADSGNAISITSPMIEETGPMTGAMPAGSCSRTCARRSATSWRLRYTSVPQSNSAYTMERPTPEVERTRVTPGMPLSAVSSGKVTSCSTSSGAMPPASVSTVTSGLLRSGNTSTGVRHAVIAP